MFQNIVICDRCGNKANFYDNLYYTIEISAHDINPSNNRIYTGIKVGNLDEGKLFGKERHYCKICKEKIEKFMNEASQ